MRDKTGDRQVECGGYFFRLAQAIVGVLVQQDEGKGDEHAEDDADGSAYNRFEPDRPCSRNGRGVEDLGVGVIGGEGDTGFGAFLQQKIVEGAIDVEASFYVEEGTFGSRNICEPVVVF